MRRRPIFTIYNWIRKRNEIEFENLFVDGTKIEANANRYSFVWKKATDKFEEKLQNKTHKILLNISSELDLNLSIPDEKISVEYALAVKDKLIEIKEKEGLDFVYGKGKRKSKLQKYTEVINDFIEKQSKYDEYNKIFNGRNSFQKPIMTLLSWIWKRIIWKMVSWSQHIMFK